MENAVSFRSYQGVETYVYEFAELLNKHPRSDQPWPFVLDTFEEVQTRSRDAVAQIGRFLLSLRQQLPQVRFFIGGRGEVFDMAVTPMLLAGFDEPSAIDYLAAQEIEDEAVARAIFHAVGGNPLSLKLAARVVVQEDLADSTGDPAALREMLRKVSEGNIQGQLYRRILEHIDPAVRPLAHPGLTLRRITPELIQQVLAAPCGVDVHNEDDAQRLFDLLRREVSLVTPSGPNEVRHRPDVRAVMIMALHNDKPLVVHDIHRAAVAYYAQRDGAEARAEEIYHSLFVAVDLSQIDARWNPRWQNTLEQSLRPALYELSPRARAWLAAKLMLTGVGEVDWDESGLPEWEAYTEGRVRDLIKTHDWQGALALLAERQERSVGSRLYFLETTILRQQKRLQEARRCAYEGVYSLKQAGDDIRLLDLLRQVIAIDIELGNFQSADIAVAQARDLLAEQPTPNRVIALELDVFALAIARGNAEKEERIEALRAGILHQFFEVSDSELLTHPQLVRNVLNEFAGENNDVLRRCLNLLLLGDPTPEQRAQLARVMHLWDLAISQTLEQPPGLLLREATQTEDVDFETGWSIYMRDTRASILSRSIDRLLSKFGEIESKISISTGGGAFISGDVVVEGGDFVGRDQIGIEVAEGDKGANIAGDVISDILSYEEGGEIH
ncbi:MAG: hypothetical protein R2856_27540 [Caldilineaceae bacterium]